MALMINRLPAKQSSKCRPLLFWCCWVLVNPGFSESGQAAIMKHPAATENASPANTKIVHVDNRPAKVSVTTEDGAGSIAHLGDKAESETLIRAVGLVPDFARGDDKASEFVGP